jgi:hypothetical protein
MGSPFTHGMKMDDMPADMAADKPTSMPNATHASHKMKMAESHDDMPLSPCGDMVMNMPMSMHHHDASMWMTSSTTRIGRKYYKALYR